MQLRFIKDLTIAVIVISLFVMVVQLVGLYRRWEAIADK